METPEHEEMTTPQEVDAHEFGVVAASTHSSVIPRTRISRMWVRTLPALIALTAVLILVAQNRAEVTIRFFNTSLKVPLSVALLGATVLGALVALTLGSARVVQLRRRVHAESRSERRRSQGAAPEFGSSRVTANERANEDSAPPEGD